MNSAQAISSLTPYAADLRARGAVSLFLFGSTARNEAGPDSDLDLFLDYDPAENFSLMDLLAIKHLLEDNLGVAIDLTTRDSLHPALRESILKSAVQVF